jgi:sulfur carrier protein ThiS
MKVTLKLFATLVKHLPPECQRTNLLELETREGTSLLDLLHRFHLPLELCAMVLVDGVFIPREELPSRLLAEGEVVAIWPPVGGG